MTPRRAVILLPLALFLSVLPSDAPGPNAFVFQAFVGAALLAAALIVLGAGLLRR